MELNLYLTEKRSRMDISGPQASLPSQREKAAKTAKTEEWEGTPFGLIKYRFEITVEPAKSKVLHRSGFSWRIRPTSGLTSIDSWWRQAKEAGYYKGWCSGRVSANTEAREACDFYNLRRVAIEQERREKTEGTTREVY